MTGGRDLNRRDFLRLSATGAGALTAGWAGAQEAAPSFRFSTSTVMYPDSPFEVAIDEIAKTGCEAVDLWDAPSNPVNHMDWVWKRRPALLRVFLENCGLKLFSFSIYWSPGNELLERLEWLAEAGGQVAVLGGGAAVGQPVSAGIAALEQLATRAEALGIRIAGENHGGSSLSTIASLREFARLAASPNLGIALAPYHVMGEGESVAEAIRAGGPKLFFLYAWQQAPGMAELPGDGTLDFLPVLRALRQVKYAGYLNLFTHTHVPRDQMTPAVIKSRQYLEGLLAQLGGEP